jgi:endonuclease/exonuclease/phosphatase family metal-dependent hydrolase
MRLLLAACLVFWSCAERPEAETPTEAPSEPVETFRVATFNVSLYRDAPGALLAELEANDRPQIDALRQIIRAVDPDILVLNEFDYEQSGEALALFARQLDLGYEHRLALPSNTGVPSGADLDGDGRSDHPPGSREYGNDSFGYGTHPGQYGIAVLSRLPIETEGVRTFRKLRWTDMPDNLLPASFYGEDAQAVMRLSSKTHAIVPVQADGAKVHMILAHPTPPGFDGEEDRNGRRNFDENRLIADIIDDAGYLIDDDGRKGGLPAGASFVIAGDLNADPADGDLVAGTGRRAIAQLLEHERVQDPEPKSAGGADAARRQGGSNESHAGDPALDTGDFNDRYAGNLRIDYVLPSRDLEVVDAGVFWPAEDEPLYRLTGRGYPPVSSDHRLVWVDIAIP